MKSNFIFESRAPYLQFFDLASNFLVWSDHCKFCFWWNRIKTLASDEVIKELREENKFLRLPKIAQRRQRDQQQKVNSKIKTFPAIFHEGVISLDCFFKSEPLRVPISRHFSKLAFFIVAKLWEYELIDRLSKIVSQILYCICNWLIPTINRT